ncbi:MAG: pilus assembly protein CpaE [Jatrophihabitans sp.]|uniref:pilus assembly protein CpaE n=1 Tax=Jatrophihabitans sp. TaxID=1932789 RepID=UPI003F81FB53
MISLTTARRLREAGVRWSPAPGDRFVVAGRGMDDDVFVVSDMTIEVHDHPSGQVIGFNGTTEWALDSVDTDEAIWLPRETQLREALGGTFRSLERTDTGWRVVTELATGTRVSEHADAEEAYGLALLQLID